MKKLTKIQKLIVLVIVTAILSAIYWGFGNTEFTLPITYLYFALCLTLSVAYVLVNGGIRPIIEEDRRREAQTREKYLAEKGKLHPIKRRDKFRRFQVKKEAETPKREENPIFRPNVLKIPEEKRVILSQYLLLFTIPLYLIFMIDMIFLQFFS